MTTHRPLPGFCGGRETSQSRVQLRPAQRSQSVTGLGRHLTLRRQVFDYMTAGWPGGERAVTLTNLGPDPRLGDEERQDTPGQRG